MGLFTIPIAGRADFTVAVEANAAATVDAQANAMRAGVAGRLDLVNASVEKALLLKSIRHHQWDAIVLDPPRAGVTHQALTAMLGLAAPKIVYVSCDPATLARAMLKCFAPMPIVSIMPSRWTCFPQPIMSKPWRYLHGNDTFLSCWLPYTRTTGMIGAYLSATHRFTRVRGTDQ